MKKLVLILGLGLFASPAFGQSLHPVHAGPVEKKDEKSEARVKEPSPGETSRLLGSNDLQGLAEFARRAKPAEASPTPKGVVPKTPEEKRAVALVESVFLAPLQEEESERSAFSRRAIPPDERRVRVVESGVQGKDGRTFVRFAIDSRYGGVFDEDSPWRQEEYTGCAYLVQGHVFVKLAGKFRPAQRVVGKKFNGRTKNACEPAVTTAQWK